MIKSSIPAEEEVFDEQDYLSMYPDVAEAVHNKIISSAREHYDRHGRSEGRLPYRFDERWYACAYPIATGEVDRGLARNLRGHFERIGRYRGYIPHSSARRPDNPAGAPSRFGGLWIDQNNAPDIVRGRLEAGLLDSVQAKRLLFFIENGYVVIPSAVPAKDVKQALDVVEQAYSGKIETLLFNCPRVAQEHSPWSAGVTDYPSKALDLHWLSETIVKIIFSKEILGFLRLIFDANPLASQTLTFYRGSAQSAHQDSAYVPYTLQRAFAASWIALEDVKQGAGELFYYPGSHRFPEYIYAGSYKSVSEATRHGELPVTIDSQVNAHVASLAERARSTGIAEQSFVAKAGDALIWHADLAHGGKPISKEETRRSVVTHYCPKYCMPLYAERRNTPMREHISGALYTTSYY